MQKNKILSLITFFIISTITFLSADDIHNPKSVLTEVMNRMAGIDQTFKIDMVQQQKGKPDVKRQFISQTHWPEEGDVEKQIRMDYLFPKEMKGVIFWEHRFLDRSYKRWRTMPVTGKLQDLSDISENKMKGNGFQFSDLEVTPELIETHQHQIVGNELILGKNTLIIEIQKKEKSKRDGKMRLWIDPENNIILKVIFYNHRDRELTVIQCTELGTVDDLLFYKMIKVENKKKKLNIEIKLSELSIARITDSQQFIPAGK